MRNHYLSDRWSFLSKICANSGQILDAVYDDFDLQASRLTGHDQSYVQLSAGAYRGRFLSVFLGPALSLHIEQANRALEQEIRGAPDSFSFGVVLDQTDPFLANGKPCDGDGVFVVPPAGQLHLISPAGGAVLAVVIEAATLFGHPSLSPRAADWLAGLGRATTGHIALPSFAARLREDAGEAVAAMVAAAPADDRLAPVLGEALLAGAVGKISLALAGARPATLAGGAAYERFLAIRNRILAADPLGTSGAALDALTRSDQRAFSATLGLGPAAYERTQRLNQVRRLLLDRRNDAASIGDLAARCGFLDWSYFSARYKQQFGELPSRSRERAPRP